MTAPAHQACGIGAGPGRGSGDEPETARRGVVPALSASRMRRRACIELISVVVAVLAVTAYVQLAPRPGDRKPAAAAPAPPRPNPQAGSPGVAAVESAPSSREPESEPEVPRAPTPPPAPPPVPDRARIAAAERALDAASRDRARADARAADAARRMAEAAQRAALDALRARKLAFQIRDPSTRIAQAVARGGFVRGERDKLAREVATLRSAPRPKSVSILSKSPVARPVADDEYHFELRHDRITFINLDKLMQLTKADAQMRVRMSDRIGVVSSKVGPVGAFSLAYELAPTVPADLDGLIERRAGRTRYELQGWELIPES